MRMILVLFSLMAIVCEGKRGRIYLPPTTEAESIAGSARPEWTPDSPLPNDPRNFWTLSYGLTTYGDLFTPRQLVSLGTFVSLVIEARALIRAHAIKAGVKDDGVSLAESGSGPTAYAEAVSVYLAFAVGRSADRGSTICSWDSSPKMEALRNTFGRQAIPMVWDFAEGNPLSESSGNILNNIEFAAKALDKLPANILGYASQADATLVRTPVGPVISSDPPYYDNIGYADLSDFFYIWLRRSLQPVFPEVFSTMLVPKTPELVATPYRHGGKEAAEIFFMDGMTRAIHGMAVRGHQA